MEMAFKDMLLLMKPALVGYFGWYACILAPVRKNSFVFPQAKCLYSIKMSFAPCQCHVVLQPLAVMTWSKASSRGCQALSKNIITD